MVFEEETWVWLTGASSLTKCHGYSYRVAQKEAAPSDSYFVTTSITRQGYSVAVVVVVVELEERARQMKVRIRQMQVSRSGSNQSSSHLHSGYSDSELGNRSIDRYPRGRGSLISPERDICDRDMGDRDLGDSASDLESVVSGTSAFSTQSERPRGSRKLRFEEQLKFK
ncbi:hypothetical protein Anas_01570 [Armadillidium nasatum]|uniref:Uncharacterized protein n=1 Tax=Armadillidium nasatum TaxID=96803 RepID=A0A5N5TDP9_9CRUS|nr:hypothetical protein Anas_01570 [Armadillidium nasatum]